MPARAPITRADSATLPGADHRSPARTTSPADAGDQTAATVRQGRALRSWPLLVLAAPAAAEVWSGWIGIAQKTGFGQVSPLPGIWPALHLNTTITLPVGVEAYAAYALNAWLARDHPVSDRTRQFAKWSAICSFALGMAGQVSYHLLAQSGAARAPWAITTIVSCLPVLVLAMGTTLAHMIRVDAATLNTPDQRTAGPAIARSPADQDEDQDRSPADQDQARTAADQDQARTAAGGTPARTGGPPRSGPLSQEIPRRPVRPGGPVSRAAHPDADQARLVAARLAASGQRISRRTLRSHGITGSNEALNALARQVSAEMHGTPAPGSALNAAAAAS